MRPRSCGPIITVDPNIFWCQKGVALPLVSCYSIRYGVLYSLSERAVVPIPAGRSKVTLYVPTQAWRDYRGECTKRGTSASVELSKFILAQLTAWQQEKALQEEALHQSVSTAQRP